VVILHAAALSDFVVAGATTAEGGALNKTGKIASRGGDVLLRLAPAPKLLPKLREWFPKACLVGWKYEVDGNRAHAIHRAAHQLQTVHTDFCVVNGPAFGPGFGICGRDILTRAKPAETEIAVAPDKAALAQILCEVVTARQSV
jgi:phosphopantothenoylcysteine decarboxylase/phosphopantothenate--cysteine ligase